MATSGGEDLAIRLERWALKEMRYRNTGKHAHTAVPSAEDFRRICRGPMVEIWKHVLDHVHSAQTVRTVKGNLALKSQQGVSSSYKGKYKGDTGFSEEKSELLDRKRSLTAELSSTVNAISHIEDDLDRVQSELLASDKEYRRVTSLICDGRRKTALLQAHSLQVQEEIERYDEYTHRLKARIETLNKTGSDMQYYTKDGDSNENVQLETSCTKGVRETCTNIGTFLDTMLRGEFGDNKQTMQRHRERLWKDIEGVIGKYFANQILLSLCVLTVDSTHSLRDITNKIDIRKDAENLKFKYEQGQLVDTSSPPSTLQSVRQLLEESQARHFERFISTEKNKNLSWKLNQRLTQVNETIASHLQRSLADDPEALNITKKLYQTELETASCRASLRTLENEADNMREQINKAAREKQILYSKYQSIQDFNKIAENKQNLIRVLAKQNINSRDRLESHQFEIQKYIQNSLNHHDADNQRLTSQLKNRISMEIDSVAKIPLPYLMFTLLDSAYKVAVIDLSINKLYSIEDTSQSKALQTVMHKLQFPTFKAPEMLLLQVLRVQEELSEIEAALQQHDEVIEMLEGSASQRCTAYKISDLCRKVKEKDEQQIANVLPVLQKRMSQATHTLTECLNLRETAQAWWEQPAQYTLPWKRVDNMTLRQWKDKWTVAITHLRQLQSQPRKK